MSPILSSFGGGSIRGFRSLGGGGAMAVGDQVIFTSSRMFGALGPNKAMTDDFYDNFYPTELMDYFQSQTKNGFQVFEVPANGTYEFTIMGAWGGSCRFANLNDSTAANYSTRFASGVGLGSSTIFSDYYNFFDQTPTALSTGSTNHSPGLVVCTANLSEGDTITVQVGQAGLPSSQISTSCPGSGATAIYWNATGGSTNNFAIAGGAGGCMNGANSETAPRSTYGTSGSSGNSSDGFGGSNGGAGGSAGNSSSPLSSGTANDRAGGGAGLTGSPLNFNYFDNRTPTYNVTDCSSLTSTACGGYQGGVYVSPYDSGSLNQAYMDATFNSSGILTAISKPSNPNKTYSTGNLTGLANYASNSTSTWPTSNSDHPFSAMSQGGFGGGQIGGWGGTSGGGGYSGGGTGANSQSGAGGGGSSYVKPTSNKFSYYSFTNPSVSGSYHSAYVPFAAIWQGTTLSAASTIPTGALAGNGFCVMKRTA